MDKGFFAGVETKEYVSSTGVRVELPIRYDLYFDEARLVCAGVPLFRAGPATERQVCP